MELPDAVRTTFACRDFTDEAVPDEQLYRVLDTARFAPSGGNRQGWKVVVVKDRETRRRLAELCDPTMAVYLAQARAGESPWNTIVPSSVDAEAAARQRSGFPLIDRLTDVPALLVVGVDLRVVASFDRDLDRVGVISGASVYPFVWNMLLAARNEGLGGALTTFLAGKEPDAQRLLGFPSYVAVAAMVPLGHPRRQLTKLSRKPVEAFTTIDRFGGPPLGPVR
jgi:nitroreductase